MIGRHSLTIGLGIALLLPLATLPASAQIPSRLGQPNVAWAESEDDSLHRFRVPGDSLRAAPVAPKIAPRGSLAREAFRPDRLQHVSLAFASGLAVGLATENPTAAAGVSIALGVGKEAVDERWDWGDLVADLLGAGLAALVTFGLDR